MVDEGKTPKLLLFYFFVLSCVACRLFFVCFDLDDGLSHWQAGVDEKISCCQLLKMIFMKYFDRLPEILNFRYRFSAVFIFSVVLFRRVDDKALADGQLLTLWYKLRFSKFLLLCNFWCCQLWILAFQLSSSFAAFLGYYFLAVTNITYHRFSIAKEVQICKLIYPPN